MEKNLQYYFEAANNNLKERTLGDLIQGYTSWGLDYEKDISKLGYHGASICAEYLDKYAAVTGLTKDSSILDIGAGTGLVGQEVNNLGYTNIDGSDACEVMIEEARMKSVYQRLVHCVTGNGQVMPIPSDSYDVCISAGMIPYLKADGVRDIVRITKPGGLCVFVGRTNLLFLDSDEPWFERVMMELKMEEKVTKIEVAYPIKNFYVNHPSVVYVYQVL